MIIEHFRYYTVVHFIKSCLKYSRGNSGPKYQFYEYFFKEQSQYLTV